MNCNLMKRFPFRGYICMGLKTKRDASSRGVSFRLLRVYENMFVYVLLIVAPLRSFPEQG